MEKKKTKVVSFYSTESIYDAANERMENIITCHNNDNLLQGQK